MSCAVGSGLVASFTPDCFRVMLWAHIAASSVVILCQRSTATINACLGCGERDCSFPFEVWLALSRGALVRLLALLSFGHLKSFLAA